MVGRRVPQGSQLPILGPAQLRTVILAINVGRQSGGEAIFVFHGLTREGFSVQKRISQVRIFY